MLKLLLLMNGLVNSHMTRTPESVSVGKQRNDCLPLHNAVWMGFFSISNPYPKVVFIVGEGSHVFCLVWNVLSDSVASEWPLHKELEDSGDSLCPEGTCCSCSQIPFSQRMLLRTMGRVLEGWLRELRGQNIQMSVVRGHTLHPKPEPKSITTPQDKAHSHVLFLLMPLKEGPQSVVPKYDLKNLFVMVLLPGFCQGGIGGTVCPDTTRSPLDYFCFPAKSNPKLPQRRKTRTLSLHSYPQVKMETCLSPST